MTRHSSSTTRAPHKNPRARSIAAAEKQESLRNQTAKMSILGMGGGGGEGGGASDLGAGFVSKTNRPIYQLRHENTVFQGAPSICRRSVCYKTRASWSNRNLHVHSRPGCISFICAGGVVQGVLRAPGQPPDDGAAPAEGDPPDAEGVRQGGGAVKVGKVVSSVAPSRESAWSQTLRLMKSGENPALNLAFKRVHLYRLHQGVCAGVPRESARVRLRGGAVHVDSA
jgi:hypothetical protein